MRALVQLVLMLKRGVARPKIRLIEVAYQLARQKFHEMVVLQHRCWARLRLLRTFQFLTNHGLALLCIAEDSSIRMRDLAARLQITERAAQRIVAELVEAGYLERERNGRRNRYAVQANLPVSLPAQRDVDLNSLLNVLLPGGSSADRRHAMPTSGRAD